MINLQNDKFAYEERLLDKAFQTLVDIRRFYLDYGYSPRTLMEFTQILEDAVGYYVYKSNIDLKPIRMYQNHYMMVREVFLNAPDVPQNIKSTYTRLLSWAAISKYHSTIPEIEKVLEAKLDAAYVLLEKIKAHITTDSSRQVVKE